MLIEVPVGVAVHFRHHAVGVHRIDYLRVGTRGEYHHQEGCGYLIHLSVEKSDCGFGKLNYHCAHDDNDSRLFVGIQIAYNSGHSANHEDDVQDVAQHEQDAVVWLAVLAFRTFQRTMVFFLCHGCLFQKVGEFVKQIVFTVDSLAAELSSHSRQLLLALL